MSKQKTSKKKNRGAVFHPEFREDLEYWIKTDRKIALRAFRIIEEIMRNPFQGIGKPEPLRYLAPGTWSRRLTQEHRLVYFVRNMRIDFLQARYHY
ncbi:MAG: Txe/YoeB family addiction module toxin [Candidatus Marinimicrobia bacterium]|nr:Txe/YoeB family addiction module toxin [bacterium]MCG2716899.1 Txe/YoeB family addiction module toxin [Candidatus Neomarinimicrobiota bacterium]